MVHPPNKPTLLCSLWTKKTYNPDSFCAHMHSIWKTKKKFDFQMAGQNPFMIIFFEEEDLESILEGIPWLFRKKKIYLRI